MRRLARYAYRLIRDSISYSTFRYSQRRGVFQTFAQARLAASGRRLGYDHGDVAAQFRDGLTLRLDSAEYPVLFHLKRIATDQCTLLDFGGSVGAHYLRYRKYLDPVRIRWTVCDFPEITRVGRELCDGVSDVEFVNDISDMAHPKIDIFLALDALPYAEFSSPGTLLRILIADGKRPTHLLLDQLPLTEGKPFVTLQNGGLVSYPHHVYNREAFIGAITGLGYELVDHWEDRATSCAIPFHGAESVSAYTGLYFRDGETGSPGNQAGTP